MEQCPSEERGLIQKGNKRKNKEPSGTQVKKVLECLLDENEDDDDEEEDDEDDDWPASQETSNSLEIIQKFLSDT